MTGAMYAAVAGLRTHMSALNVIGNNIANVNTLGYKASRYTFNEALYSTSRSGSNGTATAGGRNPAQVGYGCSVSTIDLDASTKTYTPTGIQMDCMIDGDGFFLVSDKTKQTGVKTQSDLEGMLLTRLGNFEEKDGYICDGNGNVVYGYMAVKNENYGKKPDEVEAGTNVTDEWIPSTTLAALRLPNCVNYLEKVEEETEDVTGTGTAATTVKTVSRTHVIYAKQSDTNDSVYDVTDKPAATDLGLDITKDEDKTAYDALEVERVALSNLSIDEFGCITGMTQDDKSVVIGYVAIGKVDSPNGVTHVDGRYFQALGGAGKLRLTSLGGNVVYNAPTRTAGGPEISELDIVSSGDTALVNSGLEGSGTDLATEFANMISIQRGYQANTRIITVTDTMLEELVNIKRG